MKGVNFRNRRYVKRLSRDGQQNVEKKEQPFGVSIVYPHPV